MRVHLPIPLMGPLVRMGYAGLRSSVRLEIEDQHRVLDRARGGSPYLFACRHGQLLPLLWAVEGCGLSVLVSPSLDGELLAHVLQHRGFGIVRGSSSREGRAGARRVLRVLEGGGRIGMAVDGPRGPRGRVHEGTLRIAKAARVPVVPLWARIDGAWVAPGSWDHFEVPWPGARVRIFVEAPLRISERGDSIRRAGRELADALGGWFLEDPGEPAAARAASTKELHGSAG